MTVYQSVAQIESLVGAFRNQTLPLAQWTHHAHLTVGLWFHKNFAEPEAICYLRSGIITYNFATGGKNTPDSGYHETITLFWSRVIREFVSDHDELALVDLCNAFLASEFATREYPFEFYSRDLLMSTKARATWVEPDLKKMS